jgi:hypothetical protein
MVGLFDLLPLLIGAICFGLVWGIRPFEGTIWRWPAMIAAGIGAWFVCRLLLTGLGKFFDWRCKK